ncbi:MAG TPA: sulfurtransferase TusA family protein [Pseudothermotoga sp.]|nr:sulfurtransferase TusA family protein [Pseudothermotoga sp.]HOK83672.1 sulfurtransferase TusA family protein [Pseudothermotoga sp.]HPP69311.1 sulfurtransferase TusA family protein [Pseudothermotoga sp.]
MPGKIDLVELFKILSNQRRLEILMLLMDSCLTATEIADKLKIDISTAYRYLLQMQNFGLLKTIKSKDGDRFDLSTPHILRMLEEATSVLKSSKGQVAVGGRFTLYYHSANDLPQPQKVLDLRGEVCPVPDLITKRELETMQPGETILVIVDYPISKERIPSYCRRLGYDLWLVDAGAEAKIYIRKPYQG